MAICYYVVHFLFLWIWKWSYVANITPVVQAVAWIWYIGSLSDGAIQVSLSNSGASGHAIGSEIVVQMPRGSWIYE